MQHPLSDRVLLKLRRGPMTARELASELEVDPRAMQRVLSGLRADGDVEEQPVPNAAAVWRLAAGVEVTLRPSAVLVRRPKPRGPPAAGPTCHVVTSRGGVRCSLPACFEGLCVLHAPREGALGGA